MVTASALMNDRITLGAQDNPAMGTVNGGFVLGTAEQRTRGFQRFLACRILLALKHRLSFVDHQLRGSVKHSFARSTLIRLTVLAVKVRLISIAGSLLLTQPTR